VHKRNINVGANTVTSDSKSAISSDRSARYARWRTKLRGTCWPRPHRRAVLVADVATLDGGNQPRWHRGPGTQPNMCRHVLMRTRRGGPCRRFAGVLATVEKHIISPSYAPGVHIEGIYARSALCRKSPTHTV